MKHIAAFLFLLAQVIPASAQTPVPQMIQDIHVPVKHGFADMWNPYFMAHGKVYFGGHTILDESGLWAFDGQKATMIDERDYFFFQFSNTETGFYYVSPISQTEWEIWKTDTTPNSGVLLDTVPALSQGYFTPIMATLNNNLFFRNTSPMKGLELWISDGTVNGTALLKDCRNGAAGSDPLYFVNTDSLVFFTALDESGARQLWRTDGTADGTFSLTTTDSTQNAIYLSTLRVVGNTAFFIVQNTTLGTSVWKSDGTVTGTVKVKTVVPTPGNSSLIQLSTLGNKYLFTVNHPAYDFEMWVSDGTESGTTVLKDTNDDGLYFFNEEGVNNLNGNFFFFRNSWQGGTTLWKTDGTTDGTVPIKSFSYGITPLSATLTEYYFLSKKINDEIELWSSDGTTAGTQMIKNIGKFEYISVDWPSSSTDSAVCFLYFKPSDPNSNQFIYRRLMRSDGTPEGTYLVDGAPAPVYEGSHPSGFVAGPNAAVFFRGNIEYTREGIWKTGAVPPYAAVQLDTVETYFNPVIPNPQSASEKVFWFINDTILSISDASDTITRIQLPVSKYGNFQTSWRYQAVKDSAFYFLANSSKSIWRSDGTVNGTYEFFAQNGSSFPALIRAGDSLYFIQNFGSNQPKYLWATDGTSAGTVTLEQMPDFGGTYFLYSVNDRLTYSTYTGNPSARTLRVRGFPAITFPGLSSNDFAGLEIIDDQLFIFGPPFYNGTSIEYSLWLFQNGQLEILQNFASVVKYSYFSLDAKDRLQNLHQKVVFGAGQTTNNVELWSSDGTPAGTSEIRDINPAGSSDPDNFVRFDDDHWLFTAFDGATTAWWATDGTWDGTFKVAQLAYGTNYLVPNVENAYLHQNRLYFSMNDGLHGQEPWVMVLSDSLTVSAIMPLQSSSALALWPNPASDMLYLSVEPATNKDVFVEISNNLGEIVHRQQATIPADAPLAIPLDKRLVAGVYVVRISTDIGESWARKFVLSR